jgi:SOS response regulatory protein OraA/RecX
MADEVIAELVSPQKQQTAALQAAKRKMQLSKKDLDAEKRKKRLLDFLLRRGFSYDIALKTIRTTLGH